MNPRQVQIPQWCLNKVSLVPLSSNLINANSSLVCYLIFSEIMIEILLVLFFPPVPVTLCKFIPCCMHVNSFFISFFKYSIHYWPMFPFSHLGNWLTRSFLPFSKGKEREHWPERRVGRGESKNFRKISGVGKEAGLWGWVKRAELGGIPVLGVFLLGISTSLHTITSKFLVT